MLLELRVQNLAVVESAVANLDPRFNVLTGETGAGKSVLLAGLGLALGGRADPELLRRGTAQARCSVAFHDPPQGVLGLCQGLGVDPDEGLVLSRELLPTGRSVARVNGSMVPVGALRELGQQLVDVQGQGASSMWLREAEQLKALDGMGSLVAAELVARVARLHLERQERLLSLERVRSASQQRGASLEAARLDLEELGAAHLEAGEDRRLSLERERLAHSTRLSEAAQALHQALAGRELGEGVGDALAAAAALARASRGIDPDLDRIHDRAEEEVASLRELQLEVGSYLSRLPDDSRRLQEVEERLDLLERLARRHGGSLDAAIARREAAAALLRDAGEGDQGLRRLEAELVVVEASLSEACGELSGARGQAARALAHSVTEDLHRMLMPSARFRVEIRQEREPAGVVGPEGERLQVGASGWDRVSFQLSANRGDPLRPLDQVASGGELARVALALLSHLTAESGVGTVVFDEVDQGLGGEAANRVGELLRQVAESRQVLCVTHLAAIAARADRHLVVTKREHQGRARSEAGEVRGDERVPELARLLAGEATPSAAAAHAVELLAAVGPAGPGR